MPTIDQNNPLFREIQNSQRKTKQKRLITKIVALKTADPQKLEQTSRNTHEIKVLKNIKNGISMFFPKYYVITN